MDHSGLAFNIFSRHANEYNEKYRDQSAYADVLTDFINKIPDEHRSVIDIGCGPGNVSRFLLDTDPALIIKGIDFSPEMISIARQNCHGADLQVMDCRNVSIIDGEFGGIICSFCLPYLSPDEASKLIIDLAGMMAYNGVLYLSTMLGDPANSGIEKNSHGEEIYVYYHNTEGIMNQLHAAGLNTIRNKVIDRSTDNRPDELICLFSKSPTSVTD
jgi:SAM-dependent methyltransferase